MDNKFKIIFKANIDFESKVNKAAELAKHEVSKKVNNLIKDFYKDHSIWTKFTVTRLGGKSENTCTEVNYYYGNHLNYLLTDSRFKEIKGKREKLKVHDWFVCQINK